MTPLAYPLLADENIHPDVVAALRRQGKDLVTVIELGLGGNPDTAVLARAFAEGRVVITHDSDFGQLAMHIGQPSVGIVYLRPGHIQATHALQSLDAIEANVGTVDSGFMIIAENRQGHVRIRLRAHQSTRDSDTR